MRFLTSGGRSKSREDISDSVDAIALSVIVLISEV